MVTPIGQTYTDLQRKPLDACTKLDSPGLVGLTPGHYGSASSIPQYAVALLPVHALKISEQS